MAASVVALGMAILTLWVVGQSRVRVSGPTVNRGISGSTTVFGLSWKRG